MAPDTTRNVFLSQAEKYTFSVCKNTLCVDNLSLMEYLDRTSLSKEIGRRLKKARDDADMTQPDAAEELTRRGFRNDKGDAIAHSLIANWEQGTRSPRDLRMVMALADIYGVSYSWLLCAPDAPKGKDEDVLIKKYRQTDERGRLAIQGVADSQPVYEADRVTKKTG